MSIQSTSKYLSLILRHAPEKIGVAMDDHGWVSIDELIGKSNLAGETIDRDLLERVVHENDKKRFTISEDGLRIRAAQGHSIIVETVGAPQTPPPMLFHGSASRFADAIREQGLLPMSRRHVHLSRDIETAISVGKRHGKPVVFQIDAAGLSRAGQSFWLSENGVWLTDAIAPAYLSEVPSGD